MELWFLFSACPLMMLYICTKFNKKYSSYRADMIFIGKISKGHNSVKNVGGVRVLVLCTSSDDGL